MDFTDSIYNAIVTLSTVGYGDFSRKPGREAVHCDSDHLRRRTMFYTVVLLAETMVETRLRALTGRGRLKKMITKMKNHYIICGCGRSAI